MWDLRAKLPSYFPVHKVFGQGIAGGVVPVIGGLVMADATTKMK